jgi:deazaflavin-dependent oxidoreductase (nitroreductase family)
MTEFRGTEVKDESLPEEVRFNSKIIAEFRANGGKLGGPFEGSDILLLHHTGARSGRRRVSPLAFQWVGTSLAVFATKAGAPDNPAWYYNLLAHPDTTVEVGPRTMRVHARLAQPAERDVLAARQKERSPAFKQYESKAAPRKIPVVVLEPLK